MLVITEDFRGLTNAEMYFDYVGAYVADVSEPLHDIGAVVRQQIGENYDEEGALVGGWKPLSDKWLNSKEKRFSMFPDSILKLTGQLWADSTANLDIDVDGDELNVGIDNPLAEIHHEGQGRVPARPLWEDNLMFRAEALRIADEWLRDIKHHAPPEPTISMTPEEMHTRYDFDVSPRTGRTYYSRRDARGRFTPSYYT